MGNVTCYRNKTQTFSSCTYLNTEPRNIHQLKSQPNLQSKDKESNPLSLDVASSWFSTEVDYSSSNDPKPTREELGNMGNSEK